jgi:hypothetical protein
VLLERITREVGFCARLSPSHGLSAFKLSSDGFNEF